MTVHKDLASGRWQTLSFGQQMANIGSEVSRASKWQGKDQQIFDNCIERFLELMDLTIEAQKKNHSLKELTRVREVFLDATGEKRYQTSLAQLVTYFNHFAALK